MTYTDGLITQAKGLNKAKKQVLSISGSPRKGGNTDHIIRQIRAGLNSVDIVNEYAHLSSIDFSGCIACERCRKDKICTRLQDGMSVLYPSIMDAKGLVLVSPVHNYNITSWMKAFIDRLYCFYEFVENTSPRQWSSRLAQQDRKVVIVAICEQENREDLGFAIEAMQKPMEALGYEVLDSVAIFKAFEKGEVRKQQDVMDKTFELGKLLGQQI